MRNKKILFIPADVIKTEVSRSFYFARFFSENNDLYFLTRLDPQNAYFENRKVSKFYTFKCFFSSLFSSTQFSKHKVWGFNLVKVPFMSHMVIHRFLGIVNALKLARKFNEIQLKQIAKRIKPDFIFYAEGFDLYPCLEGFKCYSDIQDDFDAGNFRDNEYNRAYAKHNILQAKLNFVVSRQAAKNLGELYNCDFVYVPNGVDISAMMNVEQVWVNELRKRLNLENKYVITYIGADAWYNKELLIKITELLRERDLSIHFVIVGNLPQFEAENVTFTGPVNKDDSYLYYWLSDLGFLIKDSKGSNFLTNSIPLKIVQYGVLGKHFLSPPISWLEEENFKNVTILRNFSAENIVENICRIKEQIDTVIDPAWQAYDWNKIVEDVMDKIEENLN